MQVRRTVIGSRRRGQTTGACRATLRRGRIGVLTLTACAFACIGSTVLANPVPNHVAYTHIHPGTGDFCSALPVTTCEEIVQVTDATGVLSFDVILRWWDALEWLYWPETDAMFTIQWPAEWQFVDASACGSGAVSVVHEGNRATFSIEHLESAPMSGELVGLCRLVLDVTSEGSISGPDWYTPEGTYLNGGRISTCGDCVYAICDGLSPVHPALPSPVLELAADSSGTASGQFHVSSDGPEDSGDIEYTFSTTAPWITLEADLLGDPGGWPEYDVTVTADAQTLGPGVHETWIEVRSATCYECQRIVFTVPETDPPAADEETWGSLKARFR
jgi:hypothetical protein